ncbi:MAG TPA: molybdenum cofactor guanylyltransferase [Blastocatellia bacterium]|nr:molybdenum cofactor guanylyltransferase [Blastocatellia bacterium]
MIAAIQAGGRSSRMGEDKAWLTIDERPMIEHILQAAQEVARRLLIIIHPTNPNLTRYEELAMRWSADLVYDLHDHRGPLGGIETALRQSIVHEAVLVLACDLPFVTAAFLRLLQEIHQAKKCDLTVPVDAMGWQQMLAAVYAADCLEPVAAMLAEEKLKVQELCARVRTRRVLFAEYAHLPQPARLLQNINTREEYEALL